MSEIEFTFVCQKQFSELGGKDDLARFCVDCKKHVINLDRLNSNARNEIFEVAAAARLNICVAAKQVSSLPCSNAAPDATFGSVKREIELPGYRVGEVSIPYPSTKLMNREDAEDRIVTILSDAGSDIRNRFEDG